MKTCQVLTLYFEDLNKIDFGVRYTTTENENVPPLFKDNEEHEGTDRGQ